MSDRILLIVMVLCLLIGGYKLVSGSPDEPEEAAPVKTGKAASPEKESSSNAAPQPHIAPPPPIAEPAPVSIPPSVISTPKPASAATQTAEPEAPPKISTKELRKRYHIEGIAQGHSGAMVMINQTPLKEGDTLDELKIEKIGQTHIDVTFQGQAYHLRAEVF